MHISFQWHVHWCHRDSLKLAMMVIFIPQKLSNSTNLGSAPKVPVVKHLKKTSMGTQFE